MPLVWKAALQELKKAEQLQKEAEEEEKKAEAGEKLDAPPNEDIYV